jgi:hypothetical protein
LLKELRQGLEAEGVDSSSVLEMLESPAVNVEWKTYEGAETNATRPSMNQGAQRWH